MRFIVIIISFFIFLLGGYDISRTVELQRAIAAYKKGDYETALKIFTALAEKIGIFLNSNWQR